MSKGTSETEEPSSIPSTSTCTAVSSTLDHSSEDGTLSDSLSDLHLGNTSASHSQSSRSLFPSENLKKKDNTEITKDNADAHETYHLNHVSTNMKGKSTLSDEQLNKTANDSAPDKPGPQVSSTHSPAASTFSYADIQQAPNDEPQSDDLPKSQVVSSDKQPAESKEAATSTTGTATSATDTATSATDTADNSKSGFAAPLMTSSGSLHPEIQSDIHNHEMSISELEEHHIIIRDFAYAYNDPRFYGVSLSGHSRGSNGHQWFQQGQIQYIWQDNYEAIEVEPESPAEYGLPDHLVPGVYEALFDFEPEMESEMRLSVGDVITVSERHCSGWVQAGRLEEGEVTGVGLVPENYIQLLVAAELDDVMENTSAIDDNE